MLSTGQDGHVCVLEASTGSVKMKFQAGKAALHAIEVTPGTSHPPSLVEPDRGSL